MLIYFLPRDESKVDLVSVVLNGRTLQYGDRLLLGTQPSDRHDDYSNHPFCGKPVQEAARTVDFVFKLLLAKIKNHVF